MQFRPALQYGQHASDGEIEHEIGFQIEVVGIQSKYGNHGESPEFLQRRNEFGELCGPASKANRSRR